MDSHPGASSPYGAPPLSPAQVPAAQLRPRRLWYVVAGVLAAVLAGVGALVLVLTVKGSVEAVDSDRSFPSGESRTFRFTAGETKAIYVSQSGSGPVNCRIPELRSGSMTRPDFNFSVTAGSTTWEYVLKVKPGNSGEFALTCVSEQQAEFALGEEPQAGSTVGGIVASLGLFFAAVVAAVAITVITAVRRGRHRRRLVAPWAGPPQGPPPGVAPGMPSGPPGPPSGPPPGPPPGPPEQ